MKRKKVFFKAGILLLSLLLLPGMVGCGAISSLVATPTPTPIPHEIYRCDTSAYTSWVDPNVPNYAKNVTVEQVPGGIHISGTASSVTMLISKSNFEYIKTSGSPETQFRGFVPDDRGNIAAALVVIKLGQESRMPAIFPFDELEYIDYSVFGIIDCAPNSTNISIKINTQVGFTEIAGLRFTQEGNLNIWDDGTIEINQEGIEARDQSGNVWVSKKVILNGEEKIIMVKE